MKATYPNREKIRIKSMYRINADLMKIKHDADGSEIKVHESAWLVIDPDNNMYSELEGKFSKKLPVEIDDDRNKIMDFLKTGRFANDTYKYKFYSNSLGV